MHVGVCSRVHMPWDTCGDHCTTLWSVLPSSFLGFWESNPSRQACRVNTFMIGATSLVLFQYFLILYHKICPF